MHAPKVGFSCSESCKRYTLTIMIISLGMSPNEIPCKYLEFLSNICFFPTVNTGVS